MHIPMLKKSICGPLRTGSLVIAYSALIMSLLFIYGFISISARGGFSYSDETAFQILCYACVDVIANIILTLVKIMLPWIIWLGVHLTIIILSIFITVVGFPFFVRIAGIEGVFAYTAIGMLHLLGIALFCYCFLVVISSYRQLQNGIQNNQEQQPVA